MTKRMIYFDTTIWNVLSEQNPAAAGVCQGLAERDLEIALGWNAYFEMLRSFCGTRPDAGKRLFACLQQFLSSGVRIIRTWEELLIQEAKNVLANAASVDLFCNANWHSQLLLAARDLSSGSLHAGTRELIVKRQGQTEGVRNSAAQHIFNQPDMVSDFQSIDLANLSQFLDRESRGISGRHLLAKYLSEISPTFNMELPSAPEELAERLLESTSNRVAHAIVRSGIYQNWRAARGKTARRCVPDDSYHVVNASYCAVFVTEDRDGQGDDAQYAIPGITVLIYGNRAIPVAEWLQESLFLQYKSATL
jgi:hypothetical protein